MNLNDCINRLPTVLRGRFSSSNSASWLQWAADGIAQIERVSVGPGNKRRVLGWKMDSGFVPLPPGLCQITNAWLDGELVPSVRQKDDRGFPMTEDVAFSKLAADAYADDYTAYVALNEVAADFPARRTVTIESLDGATRAAVVTLASGTEFPIAIDGMKGWVLEVGGERLHITASATFAGSVEANLTFAENGIDNITAPFAGQMLGGIEDGALDGCEFHSRADVVAIQSAAWEKTKSTPGGYTEYPAFNCSRAYPGRTFERKAGYVIKSNLVIEGYRRLARPATLTETLDLPEGTEGLMAAYLRWAAEADQALSSPDTDKAEAVFTTALKRYSIDQSRTDGATRPTAYQFTPALTGRRP